MSSDGDDPVRERIAQWIDDAIEGLDEIAEYEADPDGDPTAFPAASCTDNGDQPGEESNGENDTTRWIMEIDTEIFVEGHEGAAIRAELNRLHAQLVKAVMTPGYPPIGGLAEEIQIGPHRRFTAMFAARKRRGLGQKFFIHYATRRGDPARQ